MVNRRDVYGNRELPQGMFYVAGSVIQDVIEIDNPQHKEIKSESNALLNKRYKSKVIFLINKTLDITLLTIIDGTENHFEGIFDAVQAAIGREGLYINVSYTVSLKCI